MTNAVDSTPKPIDSNAIKVRQQAMWASGDFAVIGTTLQIVGELLCESVDLRAGTTRHFAFRYHSPEHMLEVFRAYYGPVHKGFAALDTDGQNALENDFVALLQRADRGGPAGLVVPAEYLETVITR